MVGRVVFHQDGQERLVGFVNYISATQHLRGLIGGMVGWLSWNPDETRYRGNRGGDDVLPSTSRGEVDVGRSLCTAALASPLELLLRA